VNSGAVSACPFGLTTRSSQMALYLEGIERVLARSRTEERLPPILGLEP
jgi:hypothetical protein